MTNGRTACVGRVWSWSSLEGSTDGGKQWDLTHLQTTCINSLKYGVYEKSYIASFLLPFIWPYSQFATLWRGWFLSQLGNFNATFSSNLILPHTYTLVKPIGLITCDRRHVYMAGKQVVCFVSGRCFACVCLQHQTGWKRRDVPPTHIW